MRLTASSLAAATIALLAIQVDRAADAAQLAGSNAEAPAKAAQSVTRGADITGIDRSVTPGDDFFRYANGAWLKATAIPADRSAWGTDQELTDRTSERTRGLIQGISAASAPGTEARKIADYYASFMDEDGIERLGLKPLEPGLQRIDGIADRAALARELGSQLRARCRYPQQHASPYGTSLWPVGGAGPR